MARDPVIITKNLRKQFGDFVAVNDISFEVMRGEIFGFLGANGAGKSTTIRMLCGLLRNRYRLTAREFVFNTPVLVSEVNGVVPVRDLYKGHQSWIKTTLTEVVVFTSAPELPS